MPRTPYLISLTTVLTFAGLNSSFAQNAESLQSRNPLGSSSIINTSETANQLVAPSIDAALSDEPILDELKGIALWPSQAAFGSSKHSTAAGVINHGTSTPEQVSNQLQKEHLGQPLSFADLSRIERTIRQGTLEQTDGLVGVVIPEQDVTSGVLNIIVTKSVLGQILVEGNQHTPDERYTEQMRNISGEPISRRTLAEDVSWISRNPYRDIIAVYQPGQTYGTSDILLKAEDQKPWTMMALFDNNGVDLLGEERVGVAVGLGDAITSDSQVFYQYLTDTEFDRYHAHFGSLRFPLPWRHEVSVSGYYAESSVENIETVPGFDVDLDGTTWLAAIDYAVILPKHKRWDREVFVGFDAKNSQNNLEFGQLDAIDSESDVYQFRLGYRGERPGLKFSSQVNYSPGDWSTNNSDDAFEEIRFGADSSYWTADASLEHQAVFWRFLQLKSKLRGQIADTNLLPSEQYSLSSPLGVRGFDPNAVRADRGLTVNHEFSFGGFSFGALLRRQEILRDQQVPFVFVDYGVGDSVDALPDEEQRSLASAGIGWRMAVNRRLFGDLSYGWQIHEDGFEDDLSGRLNARMTLRW